MHETGSNFNLDLLLKARARTIEAVNQIANQVEVGMTEQDGHNIIEKVLKELGSEKKWHPNKFRIGVNTLKSFREISEPNIKIQENDIYFIDIGPVFQGHEGDYGKTFSIGSDTKYQNICRDVQSVFNQARHYWLEKEPSGQELYGYLEKITKESGYRLNFKMNGHRLGDFPHAVHFRGKLGEIEVLPQENLWILEVLICDQDYSYGAFYEDLLLK